MHPMRRTRARRHLNDLSTLLDTHACAGRAEPIARLRSGANAQRDAQLLVTLEARDLTLATMVHDIRNHGGYVASCAIHRSGHPAEAPCLRPAGVDYWVAPVARVPRDYFQRPRGSSGASPLGLEVLRHRSAAGGG